MRERTKALICGVGCYRLLTGPAHNACRALPIYRLNEFAGKGSLVAVSLAVHARGQAAAAKGVQVSTSPDFSEG